MKVDGIDVISTVGIKPAGCGSTTGGNVARMTREIDKDHRSETNDVDAQDSQASSTSFRAASSPSPARRRRRRRRSDLLHALRSRRRHRSRGRQARRVYPLDSRHRQRADRRRERRRRGSTSNIDRAKCALLGVSPGRAATAARIAIGGAVATRVRTESGSGRRARAVPGAVPQPPRATSKKIRVRANDGMIVPLGDVATFSFGKAPTKIERARQAAHRARHRRHRSRHTRSARSQQDQRREVQPGFFPDGVALKARGDSQFFAETIRSMGIAMLTSFMLVYMLMVILYGSFLTPFVIMFSVPLALVGALCGLALTHQTLNLFSMIGIIMLFGLVAKNGILLVDYANTQRHRGLRVRRRDAHGRRHRLRPIVMTTLDGVRHAAARARPRRRAREFRRSMGTVLIGGLLSSLILTLFSSGRLRVGRGVD